MSKRERGGAQEEDKLLLALGKTVPDEVEQSPESINKTRAMLLGEFDAAEGKAEKTPASAGRRVVLRRTAMALGALALIAIVVVLAFRPWEPAGKRTPPKSGDPGTHKEFTVGPSGYEVDIKTVTSAETESREQGFDVLRSVTVEIDARDMDSGEHVTTRCIVEMLPGASEGSAPYELRFPEYPYVLAGDVAVELKYNGEQAFVRFRGAAKSGPATVHYEYDRWIATIDLD